jgi:predicted CoA-substrate-specific enzyme activase
MISAGIDVGSRTSKAVLFNGTHVVSSFLTATGCFPKKSGEIVLDNALQAANLGRKDLCCIVGTGYGRNSLSFVNKTITEISCFARGASHLLPGVEIVVDIGGQDSKAILLDATGKVSDFITNDKCAAGTGRFLETMAHALELEVDQMAHLGNDAVPAQINATCAVFAESEIVGLLASEIERDAIVAGIHRAVVDRTLSLINRYAGRRNIFFCGGVANNAGIRKALELALRQTIFVPKEPNFVGALGAAVLAYERGI